MDMRLTGARLETLVGRGQANPPVEGALVGRAQLSAPAIRSAPRGQRNGAVTVAVANGEISPGSGGTAGHQRHQGTLLLLGKDQTETPMRCAVAEFHGQGGVRASAGGVGHRRVLAQGHGTVDLRNETVDLRLEGKSKKFRLVRVMAPITLKGRFESPKIGVDVGKATGQLAIAGILGAVVSPLAAIIPFISPVEPTAPTAPRSWPKPRRKARRWLGARAASNQWGPRERNPHPPRPTGVGVEGEGLRAPGGCTDGNDFCLTRQRSSDLPAVRGPKTPIATTTTPMARR